jgi:hypothetical protein
MLQWEGGYLGYLRIPEPMQKGNSINYRQVERIDAAMGEGRGEGYLGYPRILEPMQKVSSINY